MNALSLPLEIKNPYNCASWLDTNINNIRYTELRQLQLRIDGNKDVIKDLAAVVPRAPWSSGKITEMLGREYPGEEILHELGVLNTNLGEVIHYMKRVEFWPGLEIFLEQFPPIMQVDLRRKKNIQHGQSLELKCKAAAIPAPLYQWYYYPTQHAVRIEGAKNSTLHISQPEWLNGKTVICSICNVRGQVYTSPCLVQVENIAPVVPAPAASAAAVSAIETLASSFPHINIQGVAHDGKRYSAKDKVALLIGNGQYLSERKLTAPPNDILRIGKILKKMKFKTLICKDLTKASMENILAFFIKLLFEGVYGVLYFAGHGFETNPGNCYLVPSDSPTQATPPTCVSSRDVLNQILDKNPALCLVVLDICRVRKGDDLQKPRPVKSNSSTMVVYATNEDKKAYEVQGREPLSVFAKHLIEHLEEPKSLVDLMMNTVVPSIDKDKLANKHEQRAEITATLSTPRSLHDPIDHQGCTTKFEKSLLEWDSVNQRPELQEFPIPSLGVKVVMVFTHEYSNSLIIYIACLKVDSKTAFTAYAHVSVIETGAVCAEATHLMDKEKWPRIGFYNNRDCMSVTKNVLDGIENLDSDLILNVNVEGERQDGQKEIKTLPNINLKRPLLAKLNFDNRMRGRQVPLRVPVQHEEDHAVEHDESFFEQVILEQT